MSTPAREFTSGAVYKPQSREIFICHRDEDYAIADSLRRALKELGTSDLHVHLSERMQRGIKWREWIQGAVARSQVLVFLYTDKEAEWRWCLYEIGLFRGGRAAHGGVEVGVGDNRRAVLAQTGIACIKNVDIKAPPDPIEDIQAYNATPNGIETLFDDLISNTGLRDKKLTEREWMDKSRERAAEVVRYFNQRTRFFRWRFWLSLAKPKDDGTLIPLDSEDAPIDGDPEAMGILDFNAGDTWRQLHQRFRRRNEHAWLDQLRQAIEDIKRDEPHRGVLDPFRSQSGKVYIPVVSRTEVFRIDQPVREGEPMSSMGAGHENIPSKVYVLLIPMPESGVGVRTLSEVMKSDGPFTVYPPAHVLRVRWHRRSHTDRYEASDLDGDPVVCSANYKFKQLFDYTGSIPAPNGSNELSITALLDRVRQYVEDEYMDKFTADQGYLFEKIVLNNGGEKATKTLQFRKANEAASSTAAHPNFPGKVFLPCLVCKQRVGKPSGPHETYLFVVWVESFGPQEHDPPRRTVSEETPGQ